MRKILLFLFVLALALIAWLLLPALGDAKPRALTAAQFDLLARVPEDAEWVAIIPSVAPAYYEARTHPLTREALADLRSENDPGVLPLLLGNSDLVVWRRDGETNYLARTDLLRRLVLRMLDPRVVERDGILFVERSAEPEAEGGVIPSEPSRSEGESRDRGLFAALLQGSVGHAFILQRGADRSFPPLPRPAASAVTLEPDAIRIRSFARGAAGPAAPPLAFPRGAMLSAIVAEPPRWIDQLERALPIRIAPLFDRGALFALYRIENHPLLPRPYGAIAFPADAARAAELERMLDDLLPLRALATDSSRSIGSTAIRRRSGIAFVVESARTPSAFIVAFDGSSVERFLTDAAEAPLAGNALWAMRVVPGHVVPVLAEVKENRGMRLVARDLSRGAERIYRSARWFEGASEIVSTATAERGRIRLETVVSAPK